jgi:hypothetical protein
VNDVGGLWLTVAGDWGEAGGALGVGASGLS